MKPTTRRFHLSTALVLMFIASALLWANTRDSRARGWMLSGEMSRGQPVYEGAIEYKFGWPFTLHQGARPFALRGHKAGDQTNFWNEPELDLQEPSSFDGTWLWRGIALNILCALAILAVAAIVSERVLNRTRSVNSS